MNYEAIDSDMSSWLVTAAKNGTRFYLANNAEESATDIRSHAKRFRYYDQAESAAASACSDDGWNGFAWEPISVPAAMCA